MDPLVFLGIPSYKFVPSCCLGPHLGIVAAGVAQRWLGQICAPADMYITKARNEIALSFMASECTHLLFVDDDVLVPQGAVPLLLAAETPIVSGWYRDVLKRPIIYQLEPFALWPADKPVEPGLHMIDGMGLGCTLIERQVFEKVTQPWFETLSQIDAQGRLVETGEDVRFAEKLRAHGFTWVLHGDVACDHARVQVI